MKSGSRLEQTVISVGLIMVAVMFAYGAQVCLTDERAFTSAHVVAMYSGLAILPPLAILYRRHVRLTAEQKAQLEAQHSYIETLRAQRHDIINELTLLSAYIQMKEMDKAKQCVQFIAADLSDRYNYMTLPKDAWLTIIDLKQEQALDNGVRLEVALNGAPPSTTDEQRLLPKLVANLLDNAICAARESENPWVRLEWSAEGDRILSVKNNGPMIPPEVIDRVFEPGYSSKEGEGHGWGLAICMRIAKELGGSLTVHSESDVTEFALALPPVGEARVSAATREGKREGAETTVARTRTGAGMVDAQTFRLT